MTSGMWGLDPPCQAARASRTVDSLPSGLTVQRRSDPRLAGAVPGRRGLYHDLGPQFQVSVSPARPTGAVRHAKVCDGRRPDLPGLQRHRAHLARRRRRHGRGVERGGQRVFCPCRRPPRAGPRRGCPRGGRVARRRGARSGHFHRQRHGGRQPGPARGGIKAHPGRGDRARGGPVLPIPPPSASRSAATARSISRRWTGCWPRPTRRRWSR